MRERLSKLVVPGRNEAQGELNTLARSHHETPFRIERTQARTLDNFHGRKDG